MPTGLNMVKYALLLFLLFPTHSSAQDSSSNGLKKITFNTPLYTFRQSTPQQLPANLYTKNLGFFCRQELLMDKKNIPVRFRLGSMDYCNYLEQKPGYKSAPLNR